MKKILFVATMLAMVLSLSAQRQMYVWQDGVKTTYEVANVDSITFGKVENPDPNTGATGSENGYEYVDLGLSVKWATCNLGADSPEEYGDYYAWGETSPKDAFYWSSYKFSNGDKITKYLTKSEYGVVDNKTVLEKSDDAAYANLKGSWRMPTKAEYEELEENCTWEFIYQNGVYGAKATSMKNGNTIFFPCAGFNDEGVFKSVGTLGGYWASSLHLGYNDVGYGLYLKPGNIECGPISVRSSGLSVRAVCP